MHRLAPLILIASTLPAAALGQRVTGVVTSGRVPVPGAVVSLLDAEGRDVARALTDEFGRYRLDWRFGTGSLRVVRLGFRPLENVRLAERRDTTIDFALERVPPMLDAVHVEADAVCPDSPDRRQAVAIWEQARAGLLSAIVAREASPGRVTNLTYERGTVPRSQRIRWMNKRTRSGQSSRPFVAGRTGADLVQNGYFARRGGEDMYYAPDADVLLEDEFAAAHCFGVERADANHRGQLGLAFAPRSRSDREVVDVTGVLWIDPTALTLLDLQFRYTGLPRIAQDAGAGGYMRFATLSNGVSFVSEWAIVFPAFAPGQASFVPGVQGPAQPRLVEMSESGGMVVNAAWPGDVEWRNPLPSLRGTVSERESRRPLAGAVVTVEGLPDSIETDAAGSYSFPTLPSGRYQVTAVDTGLRLFTKSRQQTKESTVSRAESPPGEFELPSRAGVLAQLCRADKRTVTLLGQVLSSTDLPENLTVVGAWLADADLRQRGTAIDQATREVELGEGGAFYLCDVAHGRTIKMSLRAGRVPVADTSIVAPDSGAATFRWELSAAVIASALRGGAATLSGSVVDSASGAPVVGADVWLVLGGARVVTDSAGRFSIVGIVPGPHLVQVRKLGYAQRRDTMTLRPAADVARTFRLFSQATMLDTVRAVAPGVRYISPALRGFEERRASGMGQYISEEVLRKEEHRDLADVLRRLPSLRMRMAKGSSPGQYVEGARSGGSSNVVKADPDDPKSPSGCWASVYVDGVAIYAGTGAAPDVSRMPVRDYAGVEFYPGAASAPPQYVVGRRAECGLLLLWTRER